MVSQTQCVGAVAVDHGCSAAHVAGNVIKPLCAEFSVKSLQVGRVSDARRKIDCSAGRHSPNAEAGQKRSK